jgi:hypothetical protein
MRTLTITRETLQVFTVKSNFPFWSDGSAINSRVAFNKEGELSAIRAQTLDAEAGKRYLLVNCIKFNRADILATAGAMQLGATETIKI